MSFTAIMWKVLESSVSLYNKDCQEKNHIISHHNPKTVIADPPLFWNLKRQGDIQFHIENPYYRSTSKETWQDILQNSYKQWLESADRLSWMQEYYSFRDCTSISIGLLCLQELHLIQVKRIKPLCSPFHGKKNHIQVCHALHAGCWQ